MDHTIFTEDFLEFVRQWNQGKYGEQRLGQAFINNCLPEVVDQELFYMEDNYTASSLIEKRYVRYERDITCG